MVFRPWSSWEEGEVAASNGLPAMKTGLKMPILLYINNIMPCTHAHSFNLFHTGLMMQHNLLLISSMD